MLTKDFIRGSKFDSDQINHSLGTTKALNASTQRQAGSGTTRSHQQALLLRHQDGVNDNFFTSQGVSLAGDGDSLVSDWRCKHYTQQTHASHARICDLFSRGSRLESSSQDSWCLSQKGHSSHPAQHVARAILVVFFAIEYYFTFHLHSSPTFYSTFDQTFTGVIFTLGFSLRRSIEWVFQSYG